MKKLLLLGLMLVVACAPKVEQDFGAASEAELADLKFDGGVPKPNNRVDVYESMARAVKYNVGQVSQATNEQLFSQVNPKNVVRGIENIRTEGENPLFIGMKALDYAVLYAVSNLSSDSGYIGETIYKKSAENLSLAAIKAHKGALYALKENKNINKIVNQEVKRLKEVDQKFERKGKLTDEELEYKKGLEVGLLKLANIKTAFLEDVLTYSKLTHIEQNDKMRLEGRKFYELEDFDTKYSIPMFQQSAVLNRLEFQLKSDFGGEYNFEEVQDAIFKKYPDVARLRINGYDIKSDLYVQGLQQRAFKVANELVDEVSKYAGTKDEKQRQLAKKKAFDEVAIAIFTQIELSFNLVQKTAFELKDLEYEMKELRKSRVELEKKFSLDSEQKIELLDKKIREADLELKRSQIMAEQAMAIRATYFYAGLDPFSKSLIKSDIANIDKTLKISFNKDMVEMLAAIPDKQEAKGAIKNDWTNDQDWLENVVETPRVQGRTIKVVDKPHGIWDPYDAGFDKMKTIQLGAYNKRESADVEWSYLKDLYPEFGNKVPIIEEVPVSGKTMYRMVLRSDNGGWVDLCNKLRRDKVECLIR